MKMKVLWFTNFSFISISRDNTSDHKESGNWVSSLKEQIKREKNLDLAIAFPGFKNKELLIEEYDDVIYYSMPCQYSSKLNKLYNNWFGKSFNVNDVENYLKIIRLFNPDVIHIFGFENSFIRILPFYNKNVIIHIQGIQSVIDFFFKGGFTTRELSKSIPIFERCKGFSFRKTIKAYQERIENELIAFKYSQYLFGRTEWDRRVTSLVAPQARYIFCQEIMRNEFYEAKWGKNRDREIVLYTTLNDYPYKGPDQIFFIDKILQEFVPRLKYKWNIAGLDEESMCVKAMRRRGYKNTNRLRFLGKLSAQEIVKEMLQSDIFVYPSLIENGCNAVQEAMLVGMPIISSSAGGLSTTIDNNQTGILIQPGDPYAMSGAIIELINDFELAKKISENARRVAHVIHNRSNIINTLITSYENIYSKNKI